MNAPAVKEFLKRQAELLGTLGSVGFVGVEPYRRFDCFRGTSKERIARKFEVIGITVVAMKPLY